MKNISTLLTLYLLIFTLHGLEGCDHKKSHSFDANSKDSIQTSANKVYLKGPLYHFIFGKHYRQLWATEVKLPIFNSDTLLGGLNPLKEGGGKQTTSVHLTDTSGKRYVLRSVDKDPSSVIPKFLQKSILRDLFVDQTSAGNPYAAHVVGLLSEQLGIFHTSPRYFYIADTNHLGKYSESLNSCLAILEIKPNSSWVGSEKFLNPNAVLSTSEAVDLSLNNPNASIDQNLYLKCRLFDFIINDWDRHADQWEWLQFNHKDQIILKPFPRDRDNAFFLCDDGVVPFLISRWWGFPKFQSFHPQYESINGLTENSLYMDRFFLNSLEKEDWDACVKEIQSILSDSIIKQSVEQWPKEIFESEGKRTTYNLIARKNNLQEAAKQFYQLVNSKCTVLATDMADSIIIERMNKQTKVVIKSIENDRMVFSRTYENHETKSLLIFALEGNDIVHIYGSANDGLNIKICGGKGFDIIEDKSRVKSLFRKTEIYDTPTGNEIKPGKEAKDCTGNRSSDYIFHRNLRG